MRPKKNAQSKDTEVALLPHTRHEQKQGEIHRRILRQQAINANQLH